MRETWPKTHWELGGDSMAGKKLKAFLAEEQGNGFRQHIPASASLLHPS